LLAYACTPLQLLYLEFEPDDRVIVDISRRNFRSYELYEYVFSDVKVRRETIHNGTPGHPRIIS
jgi:hypothetical protein